MNQERKYNNFKKELLTNLHQYISINEVSQKFNINWRTADKYIRRIEKSIFFKE